nr:hypothetical protein [uncultured Flavobacterium sp.]
MKKIILLSFLLGVTVAQAQVGFGTPTPDLSAEVEIKATDKGVLIPRIALTSTTQKLNTNVNNADALLVFNNGTDLPQGFYYWKANFDTQNQNDGTGSWIAVGSETSALPKFFYMPSVVLPTNEDQVIALNNAYVPPTTNPVTPNYFTYTPAVVNTDTSVNPPVVTITTPAKCTVNLYNVFKHQFVTPKGQSANATGLNSFVLDANSFEYYVTYLDENVFTFVSLNNDGILEYEVKADAIIRTGSFMNIVLKVKN